MGEEDRERQRQAGLPSDAAEKMKALERETRELRTTTFCARILSILDSGTRPPLQTMVPLTYEYRRVFGVERICRLFPIATSTHYENAAKRLYVDHLSIRARSNIGLDRDTPGFQ